jgi:N-methylhydantoinase A
VIVPVGAGVFSAVGLLFSDLELNELAPFLRITSDASLDQARAILGELRQRILDVFGLPAATVTFRPFADARFKGQAFELTVPVDPAMLGDGCPDDVFARLADTFRQEHIARYGHDFNGAFAVEIVNLRLIGVVPTNAPREIFSAPSTGQAAPTIQRTVYFGPAHGLVETPVIARDGLDAESRRGPFIIEEYEGTAVVPPDCSARLDRAGNVVIELH